MHASSVYVRYTELMGRIIDNLIFTRKFYSTYYVVSYPTYVRTGRDTKLNSVMRKRAENELGQWKGNSSWKSNVLGATDAGV